MIYRNLEEFMGSRGGYHIVYTDPPWNLKKTLRKIRPNQNRPLDYHTISMDEIAEIHNEVFSKCADRHNVLMWCVETFLSEAEEMMHKLGYKTHCRMIWSKGYGLAPAFTVRYTHEYLVWFYKKGQILLPQESARGKYPSVFDAAKGKRHSEKPECVYEMIEDMFPESSKIELFARKTRVGWDSFGDEL